MAYNTEQMREYQRARRKKLKEEGKSRTEQRLDKIEDSLIRLYEMLTVIMRDHG